MNTQTLTLLTLTTLFLGACDTAPAELAADTDGYAECPDGAHDSETDGSSAPDRQPDEDPADDSEGGTCEPDVDSSRLAGLGWGAIEITHVAPIVLDQPESCWSPDIAPPDTKVMQAYLDAAISLEARAQTLAQQFPETQMVTDSLALAELGRRVIETRIDKLECQNIQKAIVCAKRGSVGYWCESDDGSDGDIKTLKDNCELYATDVYDCKCDLSEDDKC